MLTAFVLLYAEPASIATLGTALAGIDGVAEVYSVTGDEDLLVIVRAADHEQIARVVTEEIAALDGINATRTLIAFRQYDPAEIGFERADAAEPRSRRSRRSARSEGAIVSVRTQRSPARGEAAARRAAREPL